MSSQLKSGSQLSTHRHIEIQVSVVSAWPLDDDGGLCLGDDVHLNMSTLRTSMVLKSICRPSHGPTHSTRTSQRLFFETDPIKDGPLRQKDE